MDWRNMPFAARPMMSALNFIEAKMGIRDRAVTIEAIAEAFDIELDRTAGYQVIDGMLYKKNPIPGQPDARCVSLVHRALSPTCD